MNLSIRGFRDVGSLEKERVVFDVDAEGDVGSLLFGASQYLPNDRVSTAITRVYWFPDKSVKQGDTVVLYTKSGSANEKKNKDGSTSHFFYWGLPHPIWQSEEAAGVLLEIDNWQAKRTTV